MYVCTVPGPDELPPPVVTGTPVDGVAAPFPLGSPGLGAVAVESAPVAVELEPDGVAPLAPVGFGSVGSVTTVPSAGSVGVAGPGVVTGAAFWIELDSPDAVDELAERVGCVGVDDAGSEYDEVTAGTRRLTVRGTRLTTVWWTGTRLTTVWRTRLRTVWRTVWRTCLTTVCWTGTRLTTVWRMRCVTTVW